MGRTLLITGGARSGKSSYAERLALSLSPHPVYLATARIWDDDFRRRVEAHRARRGPEWTNVEEDKALASHAWDGRVVMVDCLTLWATNFFFDLHEDVQAALKAMRDEVDRLLAQDATFIVVTNEIGMGGASGSDMQNRFADLMGWLNQHVAARADEVILMVCGIPMRVK